MKTLSNICRRSHAGATLLDKRVPKWYRRINTKDLYIAGCKNCVLGQLFSRYDLGLQSLNITNQEAIALGMYAGVRKARKREHRYLALTSEWRARIAERLLADRATATLPAMRTHVKRTLAVAVAAAISIICLIIP
ncbi:MAG: hypothetical protein Q7R63_02180 [bacterium]|nr:hypothetical protein [bacterium]